MLNYFACYYSSNFLVYLIPFVSLGNINWIALGTVQMPQNYFTGKYAYSEVYFHDTYTRTYITHRVQTDRSSLLKEDRTTPKRLGLGSG